MDERDELIKQLIKEKGGTKEEYLNLLNQIAWHESAQTMDPTIEQYGGGPGRGKYQFEVGKNAGAITAAKRTKQYYEKLGRKIPSWLEKASEGDDLDVTNLTSKQQDILFLGNMRQHPKANFADIWNGDTTIEDFWADYHWAGDKALREKKIKSFNDSISTYKPVEEKNIKPITDIENNTNLSITDSLNKSYSELPKQVYQDDVIQKPISSISSNGNYNDLMAFIQQKKMMDGGFVQKGLFNKELNEFKGGGTHEQNPLGGIPQGMGSNGKLNTVEEDETSFDLPEGKFIFSNRLIIE